jgi:hypothetical protein
VAIASDWDLRLLRVGVTVLLWRCWSLSAVLKTGSRLTRTREDRILIETTSGFLATKATMRPGFGCEVDRGASEIQHAKFCFSPFHRVFHV